MGPLFVAVGWMLIIGVVFVPTFVIAIVMLHSAVRAFVLSATFTMGALTGALVATFGAGLIFNRAQPEWMSATILMIYMAAVAIAGGILAVYLLGKLSKYPPWRRY
jgi:hypothetical protein